MKERSAASASCRLGFQRRSDFCHPDVGEPRRAADLELAQHGRGGEGRGDVVRRGRGEGKGAGGGRRRRDGRRRRRRRRRLGVFVGRARAGRSAVLSSPSHLLLLCRLRGLLRGDSHGLGSGEDDGVDDGLRHGGQRRRDRGEQDASAAEGRSVGGVVCAAAAASADARRGHQTRDLGGGRRPGPAQVQRPQRREGVEGERDEGLQRREARAALRGGLGPRAVFFFFFFEWEEKKVKPCVVVVSLVGGEEKKKEKRATTSVARMGTARPRVRITCPPIVRSRIVLMSRQLRRKKRERPGVVLWRKQRGMRSNKMPPRPPLFFFLLQV